MSFDSAAKVYKWRYTLENSTLYIHTENMESEFELDRLALLLTGKDAEYVKVDEKQLNAIIPLKKVHVLTKLEEHCFLLSARKKAELFGLQISDLHTLAINPGLWGQLWLSRLELRLMLELQGLPTIDPTLKPVPGTIPH